MVIDWQSSTKTVISMERPSHLQRFDYMRNILIQDGLFVIQGSLYHLVPVYENYDGIGLDHLLRSNLYYVDAAAHFYLYKIDVENQTIQLESKIHNFTLAGRLENFRRGFSVVPFVSSVSNKPEEHQKCDLVK